MKKKKAGDAACVDVKVESGALRLAAVGPKAPKEPPGAAVEPAAELDDDCSGCRTAGGHGQGRQHLLEEVLEPQPAEEPRSAGEQRHAT